MQNFKNWKEIYIYLFILWQLCFIKGELDYFIIHQPPGFCNIFYFYYPQDIRRIKQGDACLTLGLGLDGG